MKQFLDVLTCPEHGGALELTDETQLGSTCCDAVWPIIDGIPRFVPDEGYAANFGDQWKRYRRTQLDSHTGKPFTRDRLLKGTGWDPEDLRGARVLEIGCGAGRFTEVLLDLGAEVVATDLSAAVEACWENNRSRADGRLLVAQADLFELPFRDEAFDHVLCYGVLQHTPDPKAALERLIPPLKEGGHLAVDIYPKVRGLAWFNRWHSKYLWRPITTRLPPQKLRRIVEWYVPKWLPIDSRLTPIRLLGRASNFLIPCWNYLDEPLDDDERLAWAILDTYDALAPAHDHPATKEEVEAWLDRPDLTDVDVHIGGNGIEGNAVKVGPGDDSA